MDNKKNNGNVTSFWGILKNYKIEIPIIQRDYAQGRADKKEIRENFLNALYESISENISIKLDFIYGNLDSDISYPLDGQQRLTTLFLLHWYAAIKDGFLTTENTDILKKFTYETRISSREFCHALVSNLINIEKERNTSELIIDSSWFFLSWKKDPTIESMLRTIDDIHHIFYDTTDLWIKLTKGDELISFYHIDLEGIGLTDDLYIKMNARGKLLSPFENFKASFQKKVNDNEWEKNIDFIKSFAFKIDTSWTDLFWKEGKNINIDKSFINFISTIVMCHHAIKKSDNRISLITKLQEDPNLVKPSMFDNDSFTYLCNSLNKYYDFYRNEIDLNLSIPFFQHRPENNIFHSVVYESSNATYTQKALFFAQSEYLLKVETFDYEFFSDWMRVIRNLVCRGDVAKNGKRPTIIRSPQAFDGIINLILELSEGCSDIYSYLSTNKIKSYFSKDQIEEEILKARIISHDKLNKKIIFETEDTNFLQGKIDFALDCINFDRDNIKSFEREELHKVKEVISLYFDKDSDISNDLRRALLTISDNNGSYSYYEYWWSFWNVVSANKRCLLDSSLRSLEFYVYGNNGDYSVYLKKLIHKLMRENLIDIVKNFVPPSNMPNWKIKLIKETALLDESCRSHHIAIPSDESKCFLLKSMRPRDIDGCKEVI